MKSRLVWTHFFALVYGGLIVLVCEILGVSGSVYVLTVAMAAVVGSFVFAFLSGGWRL